MWKDLWFYLQQPVVPLQALGLGFKPFDLVRGDICLLPGGRVPHLNLALLFEKYSTFPG